MSEVEKAEQELKSLEAFVVNNQELERLEALLDRFNIFEAVGMKRQEIRHSMFLAFLLDPQENHGLGRCFRKAAAPVGHHGCHERLRARYSHRVEFVGS